jgi:hypothetical protein
VKANLTAFLFHANDAVDFVGGEQMAMFGVTETTLWAMEVPVGLADHGVRFPGVQRISGERRPSRARGAGDRPQLHRQHLTPRHLPPAWPSATVSLIRSEKEAGLSLLFALLLIGIPTAALVYDFFTGGKAAMKLGRRNRS